MKTLSPTPLALFAAGLALTLPLRAVEITLPRETAALKESSLPGFALAQGMCGT